MRASILTAVLALSILAMAGTGCTPTKKATVSTKPVFYPEPPNEPRLQFLMSFSSATPWVEKTSSFRDFVVGEAKSGDASWIKSPYGVAAHKGKIYVCDLGRRRVHVIDAANGSYAHLGDANIIKNPVNITIGPNGHRYVCDSGAKAVHVFDSNDKYLRSLGDAKLFMPGDAAILGEEIFVTNMRDGRIDVLSMEGKHLRSLSQKGQAPDQLFMPTNIDAGPDGNLYVSDTFLKIVKVFDVNGKLIRLIGKPGDRPGNFARPKGIAIDDQGQAFVADAQWEVIQGFRTDGQLLTYFGRPGREAHATGMPAGVGIDKTSLDVFAKYVDPNFKAEYLLFVANQFWMEGRGKINVYAYGSAKK